MDNNFIEIYENALTDDTCDTLVAKFEELSKSGETVPGITTSNKENKEVKDSEDVNFLDIESKDKKWSKMLEVLGDASYKYLKKYDEKYDFHGFFMNLERENYWPFKDREKIKNDKYINELFHLLPICLGKKYKKGEQGYHLFHSDFNGNSLEWNKKSHVIMFYLNDVEEGGETEFYHQKLKIKPKKGTCVIFPTYFTHKHKGHIPISNDKYIMNVWVVADYRNPIHDEYSHYSDGESHSDGESQYTDGRP